MISRARMAPYCMPFVYAIVGLIAIIGLFFIAARALSVEAWDAFWEWI